MDPGSNTLSMFIIYPLDPAHPRLVGEPADILGGLPTFVNYSARLETSMLGHLNPGLAYSY